MTLPAASHGVSPLRAKRLFPFGKYGQNSYLGGSGVVGWKQVVVLCWLGGSQGRGSS